MIPRKLEPVIREAARRYPIVTVTGPRQSGKTTLVRAMFPDLPYRSLEAPDVRELAIEDPRGFLATLKDGAVLDEVQRTPDLMSYLQTIVDEDPTPGRFILTGSQNFALLASISQSLAGRTAVLNLLPFGLAELRSARGETELAGANVDEIVWAGGYPAIHERGIDPGRWHADYVATYVERDVRQITRIQDLTTFQTFLRTAASHSGGLVDLSAIGNAVGITHVTVRSWLSVLETGFVAQRLPSWHENLGKRLVKRPKLFFVDTGLLCWLLGIREPAQLALHPLRGPIFENWVVSEIAKALLHAGLPNDLHFYRDQRGTEVDVLVPQAHRLRAVEVKSSATVRSPLFAGLDALVGVLGEERVDPYLVYAGAESQTRGRTVVLPWHQCDRVVA